MSELLKFTNNTGNKPKELIDRNNCSVRAVSIALNIPYALAYTSLLPFRSGLNKGIVSYEFKNALNYLQKIVQFDYVWLKMPEGFSVKTKVFLETYNSGIYIINQKGHLVCSIDGVLQDTFSTLDIKVQSMYKINLRQSTD